MKSYWGVEHGEEIAKMTPRQAGKIVGAHTGARWTTNMTKVSDLVEPYAPKHAYTGKRRKPSKLLGHGGKAVNAARNKVAETTRVVSYDVSNLNDREKFLREVATGQGKMRR